MNDEREHCQASKLHDIPVILLTAKGFELDEDEMRSEYGIQREIGRAHV